MLRKVEEYHFFRESAGSDWYIPLVWLCLRLFGWMTCPTCAAKGQMVEGDDRASPTTNWFANLWLKYFGWKMGVYFKVDDEVAREGYYVGFRPFPDYSKAILCLSLCHSEMVMLKLGKEACRFFAVDRLGREVPMRLHGIYPTSDNAVLQAREF